MNNTFIVLLLFALQAPIFAGKDVGNDVIRVEALSQRVRSVDQMKGASNFVRYEVLSEVANEIKSLAPEFHKDVINDLERGKALHGSQLTLLHKMVGLFIELDYKLLRMAEASKETVFKVLPLLDRYENFSVAYLPFYKEKKFRRLVNAEDRSYEIERKEFKRQLRLLVKKKELKRVHGLFMNFKAKVKRGDITRSQPLVSETLDHHGALLIWDKNYWRKWRRRVVGQTVADFGSRLGRNIVHHASGAFGNGMGAIRWRKGYMWKNKKVTEEIRKQLKPLDIITEKVGYTPTDFFIPGHFGHNAIWLGTKEQIQELGLWEHPVIKPWQKKIEAGYSILETIRAGTGFKTLEEFMNVDEFGLLRFKKDTLDVQSQREKVIKIYEIAFAQVGKTYDFNFDVETTDKLVCSELLYQSFGDVNWPTEPYIGRTTISPDNVVSLALFDNPPIELVYYALQNKKGEVIYKDIDDLASDIGFVKKGDVYKRPYKVCKDEEVKRPGSRGRETINRRTCETRFEDLVYTPHAPLPDLDLSL